MGRTRVVKLLLTAGADIFKSNKQGQTPLMRIVMFANNYDVRKFPELYELLHRSILNIDLSNKTVFHHIVGVAMGKGKPHAARYYMETLLGRLSEFPQELADILNFQDEDGETALTMAARCRSKRLVKLLIDHGADPKIRNRDGKSSEDYILEDERFRSSPIMSTHGLPPTSRFITLPVASSSRVFESEVARKTGGQTVASMTALLETLATSFDRQLSEKERDMTQARFVLESVENEIAETRKMSEAIKEKGAGLDNVEKKLAELEEKVLAKLGRSYRGAWESWSSEDAVRSASQTAKNSTLSAADTAPDDLMAMTGPDSLDDSDLAQIEEYYRSPGAETPQTSSQIQNECKALREEILENEKKRRGVFEQLVKEQSEGGTGGKKITEYKRLIAITMGGIPISDLDAAIGPMLEVSCFFAFLFWEARLKQAIFALAESSI